MDAEFDCPPTPGVEDFYPAPYFGWYSQYDPPAVLKSHDYLREIIASDGPYDGVIAFSEGAATAASMMLCDQAVPKGEEPLFKLGIFFNSVMLFSPSETLGEDITESILDTGANYTGYMHNLPTAKPKGRRDSIYAFSAKSPGPQITVPTLHVIGSQDIFADCSHELAKLCEASKAEILIHDGGHALPRADAVLDRCGEMFETVCRLASVG